MCYTVQPVFCRESKLSLSYPQPSNVQLLQLVEMIESLRGNFEGVNDKFLDKMTKRYSSWCAAAELDVVTWGAIVLKKKSVSDDGRRATAGSL